MFFVGIDVSKKFHELSIIDSHGELVTQSFKFQNSTKGAEKLLNFISKHCTSDNIEIGMEATGHYWIALYSFLVQHNLQPLVINPIQSDSIRNLYIRKTKTDSKDSFVIAQLIRFGNIKYSSVSNEKLLELKNLCRFRNYQVNSISDLKRKTIVVLDQIFPEYETLFSNVFGKTSKELLLEFSTPEAFIDISTEKLSKIMNKLSKGHFGNSKASQLKDSASNSFGIKFALQSFSFQLKQLIQQISFIEEQVRSIEVEINLLYESFGSYLHTITGIGITNAAIILSEIGNISNFEKPSQIVAFAGIDPTVYESGSYRNKSGRMSKRGSPHLRRALFQSALIASFKDPVLSKYYQKKRAEGKHHLTAVGAVARKMCNIIFFIMSHNVSYEPKA